eukprot:SAG11_NODE_4058_length_2084_cov_1.175819_4_plen_128_part_00
MAIDSGAFNQWAYRSWSDALDIWENVTLALGCEIRPPGATPGLSRRSVAQNCTKRSGASHVPTVLLHHTGQDWAEPLDCMLTKSKETLLNVSDACEPGLFCPAREGLVALSSWFLGSCALSKASGAC